MTSGRKLNHLTPFAVFCNSLCPIVLLLCVRSASGLAFKYSALLGESFYCVN